MAEQALEGYLEKYFNYTSFREGQAEIIQHVWKKEDVLAVLPTGSGKSVCYQLPAMMGEDHVVVISPLLSLMTDQVKQLKATGFKKVAAINSMLSWDEKKQILDHIEHFKLLYLSPEMLQSKSIVHALSSLSIKLLVIDEAHCISQWGHEFRPDYLRINQIQKQLNYPPILALTATATPDVQEDIINALETNAMKKIIYPMDKPNIAFKVEYMNTLKDKEARSVELVSQYRVPTLIYFSSRLEAEKMASILQMNAKHRRTAYYHGGLDNQDRLLIQQQFMNKQLDVICCTNAFGMGINKKDIQLVIHYHLPTQIESFIQEIGRAGREGQEAVSVTLYHESDQLLTSRLLEMELPHLDMMKYFVDFIFKEPVNFNQLREDFLNYSGNQEAHWRFLIFQLESLEIIKGKQIQTEHISYEKTMEQIEMKINNRFQYKKRKRQEMISWIHHDGCRRKVLFDHFQKETRNASYMCCDHCDFEWEKWSPTHLELDKKEMSWQTKLKEILYQDG